MSTDPPDLSLSNREIEQWSGVEVDEQWLGGLLTGIPRFSPRTPLEVLERLLLNLILSGLLFIFTVPLGLGVLRMTASLPLMLMTMGLATGAGMITLQVYRRHQTKGLQTFLSLLDEVDRYHEVLAAIALLDRLVIAQGNPLPSPDPQREILQVTRDCLVTGFKTERILREQRSLLAQVQLGHQHLAQNLSLLKTFELNTQAQEYTQLLSESVWIAERVQQELQTLKTAKMKGYQKL